MSRAARIGVLTALCALGMTVGATIAVASPTSWRGAGTIEIDARFFGRALRAGRYGLSVVAVDAAGNRSRAAQLKITAR